jgi:protein phosphatase
MYQIEHRHEIVPPKGSHYDDFRIIDKENNIFIVGDGVGSHPAPEEASTYAQTAALWYLKKRAKFFKNGTIPEKEILDHTGKAIKHANDVLYTLSENMDWFCESKNGIPHKKRAGTTLDICYILNNYAYIGHVGDSFVYLLRGNDFKNILVPEGYVPPEDEGLEKLKMMHGEKSIDSFVGEKKDIEPLLKKS